MGLDRLESSRLEVSYNARTQETRDFGISKFLP